MLLVSSSIYVTSEAKKAERSARVTSGSCANVYVLLAVTLKIWLMEWSNWRLKPTVSVYPWRYIKDKARKSDTTLLTLD